MVSSNNSLNLGTSVVVSGAAAAGMSPLVPPSRSSGQGIAFAPGRVLRR
jgi:hypothetical protein